MMEYTAISVSPDVVREEVLNYLRKNQNSFVLPEPTRGGPPGMHRDWRDRALRAGRPVNDFVNAVYEHLMSSGKAETTRKRVLSSDEETAHNAYYPTRIKFLILEEILELVRIGVLADVSFELEKDYSLEFKFGFGKGNLVLTTYGMDTLTE